MKNIFVTLGLFILAVLSVSVFLYLNSERHGGITSELLIGEPYREIVDPSGYVNTDGSSVTIKEHLGTNAVLVEFMSYTCVNCQRSFPHIQSWHEKYKDKGLVVIGIHTPKYAFEREVSNVEAAMQKSNISFPVVLDNTYATWNVYGNRYWPRTLLIGKDGIIQYDSLGIGDYEQIEEEIQKAIAE